MGARDLLADLSAAGFSITADGDKLVVRPSSALTDGIRAALRDAKPQLLALLAGPTTVRTCAGCAHRSRRNTCGQPVAAGLATHFCIRWCADADASRCPAFKAKPVPLAGRAHAQP